MQALVDETIKVTQEKGAKKMTAQHLKQSIVNTEQFDFLTEIADKIPAPSEDAQAKKRRGRKSKTNEDKEESVKEEAAPVKQEEAAPFKQEESAPVEQEESATINSEEVVPEEEPQPLQQPQETDSNE